MSTHNPAGATETDGPRPPLLANLPPTPDEDSLLEGFLHYVSDSDISLYDAQEEAIYELLAGSNVILNTPTGSGKSLVAAAAHFAALGTARRSVYTAPIKALVSEKFFALCRDFGSDKVGMVTGDASVNPDAPIICCTAEILANWALRDGNRADVEVVIMDEFHYYADPQRGWAWQVPLLELPHCQFLLMSATLGNTDFFERDVTRRTGRTTSLVRSTLRPVPLDFEYRRSTLHASIEELLDRGLAPIYLVHFTQREATEAAQGFLSLDPLSKEDKSKVKEAIGGFRFDSPIGKDILRYLRGGIGVHHAGLLPKYRLLVEKLAQEGLLKIICGTDTLGVGVNVPIRSVLFTQLCKYDGTTTRTLTNREFQQIAGRAGRKGYDDAGTVWVQAPPHIVENLRAEKKQADKAAATGRKVKRTVKKKPPERGYAHWTEDTFTKMVEGEPEPLRSSFRVNHQMLMSLLDRPVSDDGKDGCDATQWLMTHNHEPRRRQRLHIRRSIAIYRSLVEAEILEFPAIRDDLGRRVRVNFDLQDDFALHQPLSLWALEAIEQLRGAGAPQPLPPATPNVEPLLSADEESDPALEGSTLPETRTVFGDVISDGLQHALDIVTIIESVLENPGVIIAAQVNEMKSSLMADMKSRGIEYDERMERLSEVEPPRPNKEWLYHSFDAFRVNHPWVGSDNVRPKSIVRDMFEKAMNFAEYVRHYGLKRSEGVVLRYLSDVYKGLGQNVPEEEKTEDLDDIIEWLGALVRQVDSSLIDEWERLRNPESDQPSAGYGDASLVPRPGTDASNVTSNARAFRVMVRNQAFAWVQLLAFRQRYLTLCEAATDESGYDSIDAIVEAMSEYWESYDSIGVDADARSASLHIFDFETGRVTQILDDPEGHHEWRIEATVDWNASREAGNAVLILDRIGSGVPG